MTCIDKDMQLGEALFILGYRNVKNPGVFLKDQLEKSEKWDNVVEKSMEAPYIDCIGNANKLEAIKNFIKPYYDNYPSKAEPYEQEIIEGIWKILEVDE